VGKGRWIVRAGVASVVSGVALWLAARDANLAGLRGALAGARFVWLLPYPAVCIVLNIVRGEIWRRLLGGRVTSAEAFWAYTIGFVANNVLPLRLGEAARVVVLAKRRQLPVVEVAAAAGLERLLDMVALSLMLLLVGPAVARVPGMVGGAALAVALVAAALAAIAALALFERQAYAVVEKMICWLPARLRSVTMARWNEFSRGVAVLMKPSIGIPTLFCALIVWTLTVVLQWLVLRSFQPLAGAVDAAVMVAAVSLASALPAAPGFIGVYHWAGQQSLITAFPNLYDPSTALAAATVAHAASYVTSTALGIGGLWYFGIVPSAMVRTLRDGDGLDAGADDTEQAGAEPVAAVAD
jgi:uncharacterized protein (TIRG00374 family)